MRTSTSCAAYQPINVQIVFECTYRIVERLSFLRHRTFENANNHTATQYMALLQTKTHSTNDSTFKIHESALRYPHLRNILIKTYESSQTIRTISQHHPHNSSLTGGIISGLGSRLPFRQSMLMLSRACIINCNNSNEIDNVANFSM